MFAKTTTMSLAILCFVLCGLSNAGQEEKKKGGTVIGTLQAEKKTKDGNNSMIDVLAPGEEKARTYFVNYDPKIKGPIPSVLKAVRAAKVGDRVELEWIATNHGPAITAFRVLKKDSK
jgi:hypothetical protein